MLKNKVQVSLEIKAKEIELRILKASQSTETKKADKIRDSLNAIKSILKKHCEIFNSKDAYDICQGYGINLVSAQQLGDWASFNLKGSKLKKCHEAYENEIYETAKQLRQCEELITELKRKITITENEIINLKKELYS